jgi:hypothetical protein
MRSKVVLLTIIGFILILVGVSLKNVSSISKQEQLKELDIAEDKGSVAWYVRKAKITGDKQITLPLFQGNPAEVSGLDDALSRFKVISGKPIEKYTEAGTWSLTTWYKFKIVEDLSTNKYLHCSNCDESSQDAEQFPSSLLPLESDEILVPQPGGELIVDGIKLIQLSEIPVDFSDKATIENSYNKTTAINSNEIQIHKHFSNSQQFLLFLKPSKSNKIGILSLLSNGVFAFTPDKKLKAIDNSPNTIKIQLEEFQLKSVEKLRTHIQQMK